MLKNLTVLIPHYNNFRKLDRAIKSCKSLDVMVYDDGSNLEEKLDFNKNVNVNYANDNNGVAFARNWLVKNCQKKYGVFLDSDDELLSIDYLQESIRLLESNESLAVVGCFAKDNRGGTKIRPLSINPLYFLWRNPIITSGSVFKISAANELRIFDPSITRNFAEDYFFWARISKKNRLMNLPMYGVIREESSESLTGSLSLYKRLFSAIIVRLRILSYFLLKN